MKCLFFEEYGAFKYFPASILYKSIEGQRSWQADNGPL